MLLNFKLLLLFKTYVLKMNVVAGLNNVCRLPDPSAKPCVWGVLRVIIAFLHALTHSLTRCCCCTRTPRVLSTKYYNVLLVV